jgi:GTP-binding protein HflX
MKNSIGMRGPGEKKLELDKRKIRDEILFLEKKLKTVAKNRKVARKSARGKFNVCLVGYTNSGKSTLFNVISKADVYVKDELFATLDTTTRAVRFDTASNMSTQNGFAGDCNTNGLARDGQTSATVLLTDTVGFINKLPHEFIKAFESTLDQTRDANLLLHVVDASDPECEKQIAVVEEVLKNIGAGEIPRILVYNKIDKGVIADNKKAVYISAKNNVGIDALKDVIMKNGFH